MSKGLFLDAIPISVRWLNRHHDCTLNGIENRCHGGCCYAGPSRMYWPASSFHTKDGSCGHLGPKGCKLSLKQKPIRCLLFPLTIDLKSGRLIMFHRATTEKGLCKGNAGKGPHILDALKEQLIEVFGHDEYERVKFCVLKNISCSFVITPELRKQIELEKHEEDIGAQPTLRG